MTSAMAVVRRPAGRLLRYGEAPLFSSTGPWTSSPLAGRGVLVYLRQEGEPVTR